MSVPRGLVIGAGRMAGGYVAPLLAASGWRTVLVGRNREVLRGINTGGGLWLRTVGRGEDRWIGGVSAVLPGHGRLPRLAAEADFVATAVGPSSLDSVGRMLAPLMRHRLDTTGVPINVVTFENHRRAPEMLALGMVDENPSLAGEIGRRIGIGGAAVWRAIARRETTPEGVVFHANDEDECYVDAASLLPGLAPLDGSVPGLMPVLAFDDRMVEKLWIFNAGHAAAAYLGWQAGCGTLDEAMRRTGIRATVGSIIGEAQRAFEFYLDSRPGSIPLPERPAEAILAAYLDPALQDPVIRVAREPRRKLSHDDRLVGPAVAGLAAGLCPVAFVTAIAAALSYAESSDPQAPDLRREVDLLGPEEVLATVGTLDARDELVSMVGSRYRELRGEHIAGEAS